MRTNFVLIDSQNVKPEYLERLKHDHFRVVVFVGANLKRLNFPIVSALQSLGSNRKVVWNCSPLKLSASDALTTGRASKERRRGKRTKAASCDCRRRRTR